MGMGWGWGHEQEWDLLTAPGILALHTLRSQLSTLQNPEFSTPQNPQPLQTQKSQLFGIPPAHTPKSWALHTPKSTLSTSWDPSSLGYLLPTPQNSGFPHSKIPALHTPKSQLSTPQNPGFSTPQKPGFPQPKILDFPHPGIPGFWDTCCPHPKISALYTPKSWAFLPLLSLQLLVLLFPFWGSTLPKPP